MNKIDKIFIVHYKPLTGRKNYLVEEFLKFGVTNYEFITDYDRNSTSKEVINTYFKLHNLTPAQICITISHIEIYRKIIENNYQTCLILEDDAVFCNDFLNKFNSYIESIPSDTEIAFLNDGCQLHEKNIQKDIFWYPAIWSRTTCAYLITKQACSKLLQTIIPFEKAIDHELNKQIALHDLKCYWCEPTIITDGSSGKYTTSYTQFKR